MSKVKLSHVFLNYHSTKGETPALEDINLSIYTREFVSIVGPSGCGKSTLLNIIAGLLKPSKGKVYLDNEELSCYSSKLGYMFQRDHLFEWLSVWDNVSLGLKIQHRLNSQNKASLEKLLQNYNLWDFKNHYPHELSGGMRQRVALIRTLALSPEVLLLDEPFSALDYQTRLNVNDDIHDIIKKEGKTVIMVTHDIAEAVAMSSRIIILSKGPARIKDDVNIVFPNKDLTPLQRRKAPEFGMYFNNIWEEMDKNDNHK